MSFDSRLRRLETMLGPPDPPDLLSFLGSLDGRTLDPAEEDALRTGLASVVLQAGLRAAPDMELWDRSPMVPTATLAAMHEALAQVDRLISAGLAPLAAVAAWREEHPAGDEDPGE